jgi:thymidylate kinase
MADGRVPEQAIRRALASLGPYVVLRNHDIFDHLRSGGDVDLLVADDNLAEKRLVAELGMPRMISRRSYVTGLYYDWGHIDLLPRLEWRGAKYLDEAEVLAASAVSPLGLPLPRLAHEALISWFSSLLWGGFFKERYRDVIRAAVVQDGDELARVLSFALGERWGTLMWTLASENHPETSERWVKQLRRRVWTIALRRGGVATCRDGLDFFRCEFRLHSRPPLPWLAILGPDGSGKSTALLAFADRWPASLGSVQVHHLRPRRLVGRSGGSPLPVVDPHGRPPRGVAGSTVAIGLVVLDWWFGYWWDIVRPRVKNSLVVFDRHFLDVQVDPLRYRYGGPAWLPRMASRLVPQPDVVVVLDAPPDVVRARKQEVTSEESRRQYSAYRALQATTPRIHLVDATLPPSELAEVLISLVRHQMATTTRRDFALRHGCDLGKS